MLQLSRDSDIGLDEYQFALDRVPFGVKQHNTGWRWRPNEYLEMTWASLYDPDSYEKVNREGPEPILLGPFRNWQSPYWERDPWGLGSGRKPGSASSGAGGLISKRGEIVKAEKVYLSTVPSQSRRKGA
ncbi:hypothetical protein TWF730_007502 [Orbilia blumenaviensis]|uniref:Uncharacterized protein n=1 Tax=Orbilia blumenaviensis TaxID=1796055 RepID=A0AAV9V8P0_9PEZI